MQSGSRYPNLVLKRLNFILNKCTCDRLLHFNGPPKVASGSYLFKRNNSSLPSPKSLIISFNNKFEWINNHYDRITGVSELKQIHVRIIEAETRYKEITKRRKSSQEQIDDLSEKVQNVRDKLDTTNRSSDSYLRLITTEHQLLKERNTLEVELSRLKEEEQSSFDNMSEHLRHNFTLERLRQERARYMNIITLCLSVVGSMVALISQKRRDQKRLDSIFVDYNGKLEIISQQLNEIFVDYNEKLENISQQINEISKSKDREDVVQPRLQSTSSGWSSYIPGLTYLSPLYRYFF